MELISEKSLVERFATDEQKVRYENGEKLIGNLKKSVLHNAERYCKVTPTNDGRYKLTCFKKMAATPEYIKTTKGIYKYTCPLMIDYIQKIKATKEKPLIISTMSLANNIDVVTKYFNSMRHNTYETSEILDINMDVVYSYFNHATDKVSYHIEKTLDYLQKMQLLIYRHTFLVYEIKEISVSGNDIVLDLNKTRTASKEDMKFYTEAIEYADRMAGTDRASERYFSSKSEDWKKYFKNKLGDNKIANVVPVYEVYPMHLENYDKYRSQFGARERLINGLSRDLRENIINNEKKRINNKVYDVMCETEYILNYAFLTNLTIGKFDATKKIEKKLEELKQIADGNKNKFNIRIEE